MAVASQILVRSATGAMKRVPSPRKVPSNLETEQEIYWRRRGPLKLPGNEDIHIEQIIMYKKRNPASEPMKVTVQSMNTGRTCSESMSAFDDLPMKVAATSPLKVGLRLWFVLITIERVVEIQFNFCYAPAGWNQNKIQWQHMHLFVFRGVNLGIPTGIGSESPSLLR